MSEASRGAATLRVELHDVPDTALPADLPAWQSLAAHASHWLLYALMIAMPLVGWAMLSAGGYPVMLGESLRLPPIFPANPTAFAILRHLHAWLALLLCLAFLAHMAAALHHGLIRRDGVFASMVGGRRRWWWWMHGAMVPRDVDDPRPDDHRPVRRTRRTGTAARALRNTARR